VTFHVYPDPQTAPLTLAPGDTASIAIGQLTGASVPAGAYTKMMFIRVAMFGGSSPPTLFLQAGTGAAVELTTFTTAVFNPVDYVGDAQLINEAANGYQIRMGFDQDTVQTWHLGIKNNDPGISRDFTWVVAESVPETAQPWMAAAPAALPYHSLVNQSIDQSVQVANKGTAPLTLTSVSPALPAGFTVSTALPLSVPPSGTASVAFTFTAPAAPPAPDGKTTATAVLTASPADTTAGTAAGHNAQVSLTATTQRLEVVLLLDDSGSMSWDALGTPLAAGAPNSRWAELASATNQFLDLLAHFGHDRGRFGIARFPAGDPLNPATHDIVPMTAIPDVAGMGTAQAAVAAVQPTGGTPMGDGFDRVLAPATSYFGTDALSVAADRRWLFLMSDGAHNSGTHNPLEFLAPPAGTAAAGASLAEKKVNLFAIAYGIDGHTDVNHVLLKQLADGSLGGGQVRNVDDAGTTASTLALAMRDALKTGLTPASSPLDPTGVYEIGQGEVRHEAVLTRYDTRAAFVLSWNTPDPGRLRLELLTPNCEVITPENAGRGRFSHVTFRATDRSHMYLIDPEFLDGSGGGEDATGGDGPAGGGRARHGTWRFLVTGDDGPIITAAPEEQRGATADLESYAYDVLVDSTLRLEAGQDRATYFAGDPVTVTARLTAGGRAVTGASVSLCTTTPAQSLANWLASVQVPADALARAAEQLKGKDSSPLLVKQLGARLAGLVFDGGNHRVTVPMTDPDGTGTYRATFTGTAVPEHYTFDITANGVTDDGVVFHREGKQETFVLVRPEAEFTRLDIRQTEPGRTDVTIIPRDRFGNVLLVDPTTAGGFGLVAPGADLGALTSNLDGSYGTVVTYDPKSNPPIGLQFGGVEVVPPRRTAPIGDLHYPDRVIAFEPGSVKSANEHDDPKAALGSVLRKPDGNYVALGARGRLTLGLNRQVILAGGGDDDVTVFVHPDADLRSYRVEAYAVERHRWVELGESIGITQSFGLRTLRLKFTLAIRIVDTSGRTRGPDLKPLASPGAGIRGMGVLRTSRELPCDHDQLPDWLPWPR
jgi:hypothetical protein